MNQKNDYIAVFDSGVGGISVLKRLIATMPNERYLYLGDSANAPYGVRPVEEVQQLCLNVAEKLVAQGIKAIVIACNTATAAAKEVLQKAYPDLIIVGIQPPIPQAADLFAGGKVGVMATPLTMASDRIKGLMADHSDKCEFFSLPAPGLADLVEAGLGNSPEAEDLLRPMLGPLEGKLDAILLGCTHYPFAAGTVRTLLGDKTVITDGSPYTANETKERLEAAGLLYDGPGEVVIQNSSTDPLMIQRSWELLNG